MVLLLAVAWAVYIQMNDQAPEVLSEGPAAVREPEENSIAVLPFENMAGNPDDDWFVDGMTADITTDLSQLSGLFVTARNSRSEERRVGKD